MTEKQIAYNALAIDMLTCIDMISNVRMSKNDYVYTKLKQSAKSMLKDIYDQEIGSDMLTPSQYDTHVCAHNIDVAILSLKTGIALNIDESVLPDLYIAALLSDVGKAAIPDGILNKPSSLTPMEFDMIQQHPVSGAKMLVGTPLYKADICDGIMYHHENYNGTGYPHKIAGTDIPLFARIIHIADVYSALLTDRPYRGKFTIDEANAYIKVNAGTMFDPSIVDVFAKYVERGHNND